MDEMIRYIFSSLNNSETALRAISKTFRKQGSFNRNVVFFGALMTIHLVIQDMELRSMQNEVRTLQKEIKELKKVEGD